MEVWDSTTGLGTSQKKGISDGLGSCLKAEPGNEEGPVGLTAGEGTVPRPQTEEQATVAQEGFVQDRAARLGCGTDMVPELEVVRGDGVVRVRGLDVLGPRPHGRRRPGERCRQQQRKPEPGACHGAPVASLPGPGHVRAGSRERRPRDSQRVTWPRGSSAACREDGLASVNRQLLRERS